MDLNDDCLLLVFRLLNLSDQISTALACQRFHAILSTLWQKTYREFSINRVGLRTNKELDVIMRNIRDTVQTMNLGSLSREKWNIIKLYTYPSVRRLTLLQSHIDSDDGVLEMTKVFPNLRSFSPNSNDISGRNIENWQLLEELDFTYCENVKFSNFEKILEKLSLKRVYLGEFYDNPSWTSKSAFENFCKLEIICLYSDDLVWLSNFKLFSNLKKLELIDIADNDLVAKLLKDIAEIRHNDLIELDICVHFPLNILFVKVFENLQKLSLTFRDTSDWLDIRKYTPNLREIFIKECKGLRNEDINLWFQSTQIKLISVEKCKCEFANFRLNVNAVIEHRTDLLHFNFCKNIFGYEGVVLEIEGENSLLKVTSDCLYEKGFYSYWFRFL